jgi:hypothetical protein
MDNPHAGVPCSIVHRAADKPLDLAKLSSIWRSCQSVWTTMLSDKAELFLKEIITSWSARLFSLLGRRPLQNCYIIKQHRLTR